MSAYVLGFEEVDRTMLPEAGGKGANLGELFNIPGIKVPEGFCVTTEAYKKITGASEELNALLEQLASLRAGDRDATSGISGRIRSVIEEMEIPMDIAEEIGKRLEEHGEAGPFAVRSSATAEDLPLSSFAGQQDTYLNIRGKDSVLLHIKKCWASLFTERAVTYRNQNGFDHRKVYLCAVVQRMVFPQAAGILFTTDPVTLNRKVMSIDAGFGLGEAMVSGIVNADHYKVRGGKITEKTVPIKKLAVYALESGGTEEREIEPARQSLQVLTDEAILRLEGIGRTIEAHFGCPQDIEWCLLDNEFYVLQSRPITTLYPVPDNRDGKNRVYLSYGHRQMMTDAFRPLGISFFKLLDEWLGRPEMSVAGGRFYKDMTYELASPVARKVMIGGLGQVDVLMRNAFVNLLKRREYIKSLPHGKTSVMNFGRGGILPMMIQFVKMNRINDAAVVRDLIASNEASVERLRHDIAERTGDELFAFIIQDYKELTDIMFEPKSVAAAYLGIYSANWIDKNLAKWLGEKNAADILAQSAPNNVISSMGLELLDVADVIRKYPEVIHYLDHAADETFFEGMAGLAGGGDAVRAIRGYLQKYGMHCSGDIDITRPRWSERPTLLVPTILGNIKNFEPGEHAARLKRGEAESKEKTDEILKRLSGLPGGRGKVKKTERMIRVLRNFIGYREYSKHACLQRYGLYKQALMKEAGKLAEKGVIRETEDINFLYFEELHEAVHTGLLDYSIVTRRKEEHEINRKLTPPRVMTSDGEVISGEYDDSGIPDGALAGIPVSSGVVEGRARVIMKLEDADIGNGDILVTVFTDPSWSTLFISAKGVVMEVGGVMTHGAVIAREYGLPAVVGVENATKRIKDGQTIRVNGSKGYVEIL